MQGWDKVGKVLGAVRLGCGLAGRVGLFST